MVIPSNWQLPDSIRRRLGQQSYGRQRAIVEEGHMLLILHKPPGPDQEHRDGVLFWRDAAGEWRSTLTGPGINALKTHVQSYVDLESRLAQAYDKAIDAEALFHVLESLTPLVRAGRNMHQALQQAREAVREDRHLIDVRDQAYDVERNLSVLLEDVRNAADYKIARASEEQAKLSREALKASHRLNMLAALFFPLTAVASVFGMSLPSGLDGFGPLAFWAVFALGLGVGISVKNWVLGSGPGKAAS